MNTAKGLNVYIYDSVYRLRTLYIFRMLLSYVQWSCSRYDQFPSDWCLTVIFGRPHHQSRALMFPEANLVWWWIKGPA